MSSCKVCGMELPEGSGIICDNCLEELRMKTPIRVPKKGAVPPASVNDVTMDTEWLSKAVQTIKDGIADKLEKDNIKVYRVPSPNGNSIIRIDIKE